jgi:hypothetical protein
MTAAASATMNAMSERRPTDDPDAELSATPGWFECWCGCEWWIAESGDVPLNEPCDRCADPVTRHALHREALAPLAS